MSIKSTMTKAAEEITGRKCNRCLHNCKGRCCHPDGAMFWKCWQSITRPGFEKRPPRYLRYEHTTQTLGRATVEKTAEGVTVKAAPLTPQQLHELAKIKAALQQAEDTARESGLLED